MGITEGRLTFLDHCEELRKRLIKSLIAIAVCSLIFYYYIDTILAIIIKPIGSLIFTSPQQAFLAKMNLTLLGGFLLSLPIVLYQIWRFVSLGLTSKEKRQVFFFGPFSLICFLVGVAFAYFVMIPFTLKFLLSFSSDRMVPMITVNEYIIFVGTLILVCGVTFELPLLILFLTKIGIATPEFLRQKRKHAIILILIISAIITPPDALSQILVSIPLIVLYEIGIFVSQLTLRSER